ncbi:hypothetical protein [Streptomyces sp. NBC_01803]|uniref:hypothetical protein n=1 Tax=Streptomyces sp. NBC_01803 TaxID=2975946 RepID=UPI002DD95F96|nr:hypothetical protein [Streptomyces sp. NBC_01803]WSA46554.1 hypothetical protein OIE51_21635 [Streptomyces sp. NBC_01803]
MRRLRSAVLPVIVPVLLLLAARGDPGDPGDATGGEHGGRAVAGRGEAMCPVGRGGFPDFSAGRGR